MAEHIPPSQQSSLDISLPADDLAHLEVAFDLLGKHRFGGEWGKNMSRLVRLGERSKAPGELGAMARWALDALTICVQNGWLPLYYFEGDSTVRRIEFFRNPDGLVIVALYPKPTDDIEQGGMIEVSGGGIFPCMVNLADFDSVLVRKFGAAQKRRGPRRQFSDFDDALDDIFQTLSTGTSGKDVISALRLTFKGQWPKRTTMYARIDEAAQRAIVRARSGKTSDVTADGER